MNWFLYFIQRYWDSIHSSDRNQWSDLTLNFRPIECPERFEHFRISVDLWYVARSANPARAMLGLSIAKCANNLILNQKKMLNEFQYFDELKWFCLLWQNMVNNVWCDQVRSTQRCLYLETIHSKSFEFGTILLVWIVWKI